MNGRIAAMNGDSWVSIGTVRTAPDVGTEAGTVAVQVLGPVEAWRDGSQLRLGGPKQRTLLGLLVAVDGFVGVDALIDGLWGEAPPASSRGVVQTYVSALRGILGDVITREGDGYRLVLARDSVDSWRFEDEVAAARTELGSDPEAAGRRLAVALSWWKGHPFAGLLASSPLAAEARRLQELRLEAVESRLDSELSCGRHDGLVGELESLTAEHPLRERLRALHMLALYRSGRQADALRVYERTSELLRDELGIDPSTELREMQRAVLSQDPTLDPPASSGELRVERRVLLFTDIEDSTALWEMRPAAMSSAVAHQDRIVTAAVEAAGGRVVKRVGDAIDATFDEVGQAVAAAEEAQRDLAAATWDGIDALRLRMAIDVGEVEARGSDLFGPALNRLGRILVAGHGGQILLSSDAHRALSATQGGWKAKALGEYRFKGIGRPQAVFQLLVDGLPAEFPPLRIDRDPDGHRPPSGRVVRGYELRGRVGAGTYGTVYRAYQPSVGREVAVKVIRPEFVNQPTFVRRFEADAQIVARLEHPHIATLIDYWRDPDGAYLVSRWLVGGSLAQTLERGPWNLRPAVELLDQVGSALIYAHRRGMVHGDVRPSNILLDEEGHAYLSDFAVVVAPPPGGGPLATAPAYLPPERLAGRAPTAATDIYGLGLVCFELFAGQGPPLDTELPRLSEFRSHVPPEIDAVIANATAVDPAERYPSVGDLLDALHAALDLPTTTVDHDLYTQIRNPYKGLRAFSEADAGDFHGRDGLVGELVSAVGERRLVAVVGPSGIGKSSVVHAGLLPALRAGAFPGASDWLITDMYPGAWPFEELEGALLRVATHRPPGMTDDLGGDARGLARVTKRALPAGSTLLLVIDQFEEVFTLTRDEEARRRLLDALTAAVEDPRSRLRVVVTLRADFLDHPLRYPAFGELMRAGTVMVTAPDDRELAAAVRRPAEVVGVRFERGLVERIVDDVERQPGALPLAQYALTELFAARTTDLLTTAAYEATGGVLGALGTRAEQLHTDLDPAAREVTRQVFLRLVAVHDGAQHTRRRVHRRELLDLDTDTSIVDGVLEAYGAHRLLTFDRDAATRGTTVEVAHEALLSHWPRLRGWIDERRNDLVIHRRLTDATAEWADSGRDASYLLRGGRLDHHEGWAAGTDLRLTATERDYLDASRTDAIRRRTRTRRRRRTITALLAAAAVIATLLAVLATTQRDLARSNEQRAEQEAARADREADVARSRELAASAIAVLGEDPALAKLLALAAASVTDPPLEVVATLHQAHAADSVIARYDWSGDSVLWTDLHPDARLTVASGAGPSESGNHLEVADLESGEVLWSLSVDGDESLRIGPAYFSPDGNVIAGVWWEPTGDPPSDPDEFRSLLGAHIWDARTGDLIERFDLGRCGGLVTGATDTHLLVRQVPGGAESCWGAEHDRGVTVDVIDLRSGDKQRFFDRSPLRSDGGAALSGDARYLAVNDGPAEGSGPTVVVDLTTGERVLEFDPMVAGQLDVVVRALNADGSLLLVGDRPIQVWDVATGELLSSFEGHAGESFAGFAPSGDTVYSTGRDATLRHWEARTGEEIAAFPGVGSGRASATDDGLVLVGDVEGGTAKLVDPRLRGEVGGIATCGGFAAAGSLDAHGDIVTLMEICNGDDHMTTQIIDVRRGELIRSLPGAYGQTQPISPDGTRFARQEAEGSVLGPIVVRGIRTGEVLVELEGLCHWDSMLPREEAEGCAAFPEPPFAVWALQIVWSPDGTMIAVADHVAEGYLAVWDARDGTLLHTRERPVATGGYLGLVFTPDSTGLVVPTSRSRTGGFESLSTGSWDTTTEARSEEEGEVETPALLGYSPDGSTLIGMGGLFGMGGGSLHWIDADTLEQLRERSQIHDGSPKSFAFSPDRTRLATGASDGFIRIWDTETGRLEHEIPFGNTQIQGLAFVSDHHLAVAPEGGNVFVVTTDTDELLDIVRGTLTRGFTDAECERYNFGDGCPTLEDLRTTT